jgi:hypothetical protein
MAAARPGGFFQLWGVDMGGGALFYWPCSIVRAARRAPFRGDSGKWLPKCGAQSSKNKTITYFYQRNPIQVSETFIAGHNKWSKVKRIKGALDAKRGKFPPRR